MPGAAAEAEAVRRRAREVCSARDVDGAIERMAGVLASDLAGRDPVVLAVMSGGVFTASALCRHFDFPYTFEYVHVTRYGEALVGGELDWRVAPRASLAGRTVLVVDDVLDHGITLAAILEALRACHVAELCVAVLARKAVETAAPRPRVDVVGIETADEYLFGCGMDYKGYWRGLPALYAVPAS